MKLKVEVFLDIVWYF